MNYNFQTFVLVSMWNFHILRVCCDTGAALFLKLLLQYDLVLHPPHLLGCVQLSVLFVRLCLALIILKDYQCVSIFANIVYSLWAELSYPIIIIISCLLDLNPIMYLCNHLNQCSLSHTPVAVGCMAVSMASDNFDNQDHIESFTT